MLLNARLTKCDFTGETRYSSSTRIKYEGWFHVDPSNVITNCVESRLKRSLDLQKASPIECGVHLVSLRPLNVPLLENARNQREEVELPQRHELSFGRRWLRDNVAKRRSPIGILGRHNEDSSIK